MPARAWVETATYDVPGGGIADCLRAAGAGRLALLGPLGRASTPIALLGVGADGGSLTPAGGVSLGWLSACPVVAAADGEPPLLAGPVVHVRQPALGAGALAVASPSGVAATLPEVSLDSVALAAAPGGAAVVAWAQDTRDSLDVVRLLAAIRPAGSATFGAPTVLDRSASFETTPVVGIDTAGRATVAWQHVRLLRGDQENDSVRVADAAPGGSFGPAQQLAPVFVSHLALAVAPQGRALLAVGDYDGLTAYERPASDGRFAPLRLPHVGSATEVAAALNPDGGAVIGYRPDPLSVAALARVAGGDFGAPSAIVPRAPSSGGGEAIAVSGGGSRPTPPPDDGGHDLTAALRPDGRALLTWVDDAHGSAASSAHVAAGMLASGFGRASRLGSPCRPAAAARPLALADGALGVAFSDDARTTLFATATQPLGGGRVHVALPGAPQATPAPAPRLTVRLVSRRPLGPGEPLRLGVRCSARCDVRVTATARRVPQPRWLHRFSFDGRAGFALGASTSVASGRETTVVLRPFDGLNAAGVRGAPRPPIVVIACTPDGPLAQRLTLAPPPIRTLPPLPRVVDLVAHRLGRTVDVSWRTTLPARAVRFYVAANGAGDRLLATAQRTGGGRTRFAVVLRPAHGARAQEVVVDLESPQLFAGAQFSTHVR